MITVFVFFLAQFGLAYIVGHSKISEPFRWLLAPHMVDGIADDPPRPAPGLLNGARHWIVSLLECPACFGFWAGMAGGHWLVGHFDTPHWLTILVFGCATSGSNFLLGRWAKLI